MNVNTLSKIDALSTLSFRTKARLATALSPLLDAVSYAACHGKDLRDFAVPMSELVATGLTSVDCSFLADAGIVAVLSRGKAAKGHWKRNGSRPVSADRLIVLTDAGIQWVAEWVALEATQVPRFDGLDPVKPHCSWPTIERIFYEASTRELYVAETLVLALGCRACSKGELLTAFQREKWATRIENPLKDRTNGGRAQQLRDAMHGLNKLQRQRHGCVYVKFHAEDKGRTARYEVTSEGNELARSHRRRTVDE